MSALTRIASLHRELAQAYEDMDRAEHERKRPKREPLPASDVARPEVRSRVRNGLRRAGIRT